MFPRPLVLAAVQQAHTWNLIFTTAKSATLFVQLVLTMHYLAFLAGANIY